MSNYASIINSKELYLTKPMLQGSVFLAKGSRRKGEVQLGSMSLVIIIIYFVLSVFQVLC